MANMVINSKSEKKSIQMLKHMVQRLVGEPKYEGEVCVISVPANPISGEFNSVFHSNMCQSFIKELGYEVVPICESLAVIYATNPSIKNDNGEVVNMTGIGISCGGGGINCCLAYRGVDTIRFSYDRSGDWIDQQTASVCSLSPSEVSMYKEKKSLEGKFDLLNPDYSDEVIAGLCIYYKFLVETVIKQFKEEFIKNGTQFSDPIEVIVSGGTSKPNGFESLVEGTINQIKWPFDIKGVRRAKDPLSATAIGCLAAAQSREKKK